jgi:hypothetical protein
MQFSWACKALLKGNGHAKQEKKGVLNKNMDVKNG